jgi:4-amino-4-deoxy-L-arabinose transferase-like glycosyltransferase
MLLASILTLPLIYWVARHLHNERLALLSIFFLAISPWHILLSRWGLDQNLFPFAFTLAFALLLESIRSGPWMIAACILFGLCFYIYGPSYFIVPVVLGASTWLLLRRKLLSVRYALIGLGVFCLFVIPIGIFILVNGLGLDAVSLGPVTIPRMPSTPRFLSEVGGFREQVPLTLWSNLRAFLRLLVGQTDGLIYNAFEPFGYFYKVTFPLALIGIVLLFRKVEQEQNAKRDMFLAWILSSLAFGVLQPVNINRINIIFIPLIICTALAVDWLGTSRRSLYLLAIAGLTAGFVWFTIVYHGPGYRTLIDQKFHHGLLPAIKSAGSRSSGPVCITDKIDMAYIYVLFVEKPDPTSVLETIQYVEAAGPLRPVRSFGRYTFGWRNCSGIEPYTYVLTADEIPPRMGNRYDFEFFDTVVVYYPRP